MLVDHEACIKCSSLDFFHFPKIKRNKIFNYKKKYASNHHSKGKTNELKIIEATQSER